MILCLQVAQGPICPHAESLLLLSSQVLVSVASPAPFSCCLKLHTLRCSGSCVWICAVSLSRALSLPWPLETKTRHTGHKKQMLHVRHSMPDRLFSLL